MSQAASPRAEGFSIDAVSTVARKEFMDNVRGRWVLLLTVLFAALTLVFSLLESFTSGKGAGLGGFRGTVVSMMSIAGLLIPILAIMLSYATIAGERESGALQLLLTMPLTRLEILVGKVVGLTLVVWFAVVVGLGVSGLAIVAVAGTDGGGAFLVFVGACLLGSLAFVSIGTFFSSLVAKRSTALALAIFLWILFSVIWETVLVVAMLATSSGFDITQPSMNYPDWYFAIDMLNPAEAMGLMAQAAFGNTQILGISFVLPGFVSVPATCAVLVAWAVGPLLLGYLRFRRADL